MENRTPKFKKGTPEHREHMRAIGLRGGNSTKFRMLLKDPEYYQKVGRAGGEAIVKKYGKAHFVKAAAMRESYRKEREGGQS